MESRSPSDPVPRTVITKMESDLNALEVRYANIVSMVADRMVEGVVPELNCLMEAKRNIEKVMKRLS
jgi:hypothetical protein